MKKILWIFLFITSLGYTQTKDEVLEEGLMLYKSEKASWHGTDIFLENYPEKKNQIGGYFSYSDKEKHYCIFYDQNEEPNVLAMITFDDGFNVNKALVDTTSRKLTEKEFDYYDLRNKVTDLISKDTLFKQYNNTGINPIPIITKKERKVYVLTGAKVSGIVIFGNDYLITFDKNNEIKTKKKLHNNILVMNHSSKDEKEGGSFHSHNKATGNLITTTDICTLMLYGKYTGWKQHYVMSEENVSIWNCEKESLFVMTRKAWDKIYNDIDNKDK